MWFIAHTGTPGCEHVMSVDFEKCIVTLPEQDTLLEAEFELLQMPLNTDARPVEMLAAQPSPPPPSPIRASCGPLPPPPPPPPPPSPILSCRSVTPTEIAPATLTPTPLKRRQHTLLSDGIICKWVDVHGPTWRALARSLGGRILGWSDDVVRNRYIRIVETLGGTPYERRVRTPDVKKPETAIEKWTEEEDVLLTKLFKTVPKRSGCHAGVPWKTIAKRFGGLRTPQAIRNRASRLGLRDNTLFTGVKVAESN
jgi:hypothetical protein